MQSESSPPPSTFRIRVARAHGFCFGVRDAIAAAEQAARRGPVTVLGRLVHNPVVREQLAALGVREGDAADPASASTPAVMFTAHGVSDRVRRSWEAGGRTVLDATCPLVHRAHSTLLQLAAAGLHPVVIGLPGHPEVRGLTGDLADASVIHSPACLDTLPYKAGYGVVAQTTQPPDHVHALVAALRAARPDARVEFRDTVCQPTRDRQDAALELARTCDAVVVVGGRESHNTRQLAATIRGAGRPAWQVERASELQPRWFDGCREVGLTAGTSTPDATIDAVRERLEAFARAAALGLLDGNARGTTDREAA